MQRPLRILGALAVLAVPLAATQLPPVRAALLALLALMRSGSPSGMALYVGAYAAGSVFTAPVALFSGMAGYAYGPVRGVLIASPANVLAATAAFLVGRFLLSARIARAAEHMPRWHAMQRAVDEQPFRIAALLRLAPIVPQNFLTYTLSLTRVRLGTFMLATWIGLFPAICFQVYVGSLVRDASELLDGKRPPLGAAGWIATAAGLVGTAVIVFLLARFARRALARSGV